MGNFAYGFHILWRIWRESEFAEKVRRLEAQDRTEPAGGEPPPAPAPLRRSEALTLLSVLQREARFVDFVQEPVAAYSDAQIGAAVREVHKGCAAVLERMFGLEPLASAAEGASVQVPKGYDPIEYRLTGQVRGEAPYHGTLCHHGWKASRCNLPDWTGQASSVMVVAPAEVEVK